MYGVKLNGRELLGDDNTRCSGRNSELGQEDSALEEDATGGERVFSKRLDNTRKNPLRFKWPTLSHLLPTLPSELSRHFCKPDN